MRTKETVNRFDFVYAIFMNIFHCIRLGYWSLIPVFLRSNFKDFKATYERKVALKKALNVR